MKGRPYRLIYSRWREYIQAMLLPRAKALPDKALTINRIQKPRVAIGEHAVSVSH